MFYLRKIDVLRGGGGSWLELFLIFFAVWRCLEAGWDMEAIILEAGRAGSWKMEA